MLIGFLFTIKIVGLFSTNALSASCNAPGYVRSFTESIIDISTGDVVRDLFDVLQL